MDITTKFIQDILYLENTISLFNEKYMIDKSIFDHDLQCNLQMFYKKITYLEKMWSRNLAGEISYSNCLDNMIKTSSNKLDTISEIKQSYPHISEKILSKLINMNKFNELAIVLNFNLRYTCVICSKRLNTEHELFTHCNSHKHNKTISDKKSFLSLQSYSNYWEIHKRHYIHKYVVYPHTQDAIYCWGCGIVLCLDDATFNEHFLSSDHVSTAAYKALMIDKLNWSNLTNKTDEFQSYPSNKKIIDIPELNKNQLSSSQIKNNITEEAALVTSDILSKNISGSEIISESEVSLFAEVMSKDNLIQICEKLNYCLQCDKLLRSSGTSHISGKTHKSNQHITPSFKSSDILVCLVCNLVFFNEETFNMHIKQTSHIDLSFLQKDCPKCHIKLFGSLEIIYQHEHFISKSKEIPVNGEPQGFENEVSDIVAENQPNCFKNERIEIKSNLDKTREIKKEVHKVQHEINNLKQKNIQSENIALRKERLDLNNEENVKNVEFKSTINNAQSKEKCSYAVAEINSLSIYNASLVTNCLLCLVHLSKNSKTILQHVNGSRHTKNYRNSESIMLLKPFINKIFYMLKNDKDDVFRQNIDFLFPYTKKAVLCKLCDDEISNKAKDILIHFKSSKHIKNRKSYIKNFEKSKLMVRRRRELKQFYECLENSWAKIKQDHIYNKVFFGFDDENNYFCDVCNIDIDIFNGKSLKNHIEGHLHKHNLSRINLSHRYYCHPCNLAMQNVKLYEMHLSESQHKNRLISFQKTGSKDAVFSDLICQECGLKIFCDTKFLPKHEHITFTFNTETEANMCIDNTNKIDSEINSKSNFEQKKYMEAFNTLDTATKYYLEDGINANNVEVMINSINSTIYDKDTFCLAASASAPNNYGVDSKNNISEAPTMNDKNVWISDVGNDSKMAICELTLKSCEIDNERYETEPNHKSNSCGHSESEFCAVFNMLVDTSSKYYTIGINVNMKHL
ncbi:uncharacterized protein LOC113366526 isoform X2 [Ctenocephalides felis]|uniref:uncharacterized protein LOC113366526 isoform X2 n=1 Tax=Ctenocephalides felis TaxID=7515 RepID=UPI000E6E2889|nr:uncharacterized protein LOC113366526 isoform X2 [Ctenocephalides felis]